MEKYRLFDFHTHVYPDAIAERAVVALNNFYEFVCDCSGTYGELESTSAEAGVEGFLLLGTATNAHQVEKVNDYVAQCVLSGREHGFDSHGFAAMHQDMNEFEHELDRVRALGLEGVKIHPDIQRVNIDDEKLMPLYRACEARGMPVYLHVGDNREQYRYSEIGRIDRIISACPDLIVIAAHFGGYSAWEYSDAFAGNTNVYYDTSSALEYAPPESFERLVDKLGHKQIMFGTDYPCTTASRDFERFMKLELDHDVRCDILYNNAVEFFKRIEKR